VKFFYQIENPDEELRVGSLRKTSKIAGAWKHYYDRKIFRFFQVVFAAGVDHK
jgi:hypothetical protein